MHVTIGSTFSVANLEFKKGLVLQFKCESCRMVSRSKIGTVLRVSLWAHALLMVHASACFREEAYESKGVCQ